jgi:hypothetical protein
MKQAVCYQVNTLLLLLNTNTLIFVIFISIKFVVLIAI